MSEDFDVDDVLAHYGVKGMKWGQRRAAKAQAKFGARAEAVAKDARTNSRLNQKAIEDISKHGKGSQAFNQMRDHASNQAGAEMTRRGYGAMTASVTALATHTLYTTNDAISTLKESKRGHDATNRVWSTRAKNVRAIDITTASRRDIKRAYKGKEPRR